MASSNGEEPFPWDIGVFDAHCHPTDTMTSIDEIPSMKARALTIMATRAEDQSLVSAVTEDRGIKSPDPTEWEREQCVIPAFGWHPWFSHQMYISDSATDASDDSRGQDLPEVLTGDAKIKHYQTVLQPFEKELTEKVKRTFLSLPDPRPFSHFLSQTRSFLESHPHALVGEIGLDRSFRIPEPWTSEGVGERDQGLTPGGREGRRLSPYRVHLQYQKKIFQAQLKLAAELGRAVSVHGVGAHGVVFEAISELWKGHEKKVANRKERKTRLRSEEAHKEATSPPDLGPKPYPPRICLHSFSGNLDAARPYLDRSIPAQIFFSFSTAINLGNNMEEATPKAFADLIRAIPDHMLLVESDLHTAGKEMDDRLEDIVRRVCEIKGWGLAEGVRQLAGNWRTFVFGKKQIRKQGGSD